MSDDWIVPDWPAPPSVRALLTTRRGGVSVGPYASLNLGRHVGDDAAAVAENRRRLAMHLPVPPLWLEQVHGTRAVRAEAATPGTQADAAWTDRPGAVCAVLTADCLPVLLCDDGGAAVGIAHAGWRGLALGVIEAAIAAMACPARRLLAYLGPAIGPGAFAVGDEVRQAFTASAPEAARAFAPHDGDKWLADLYLLARQRLARAGVTRVYGGGLCTYTDRERFYSYRRERVTGRMASLIWLNK